MEIDLDDTSQKKPHKNAFIKVELKEYLYLKGIFDKLYECAMDNTPENIQQLKALILEVDEFYRGDT